MTKTSSDVNVTIEGLQWVRQAINFHMMIVQAMEPAFLQWHLHLTLGCVSIKTKQVAHFLQWCPHP